MKALRWDAFICHASEDKTDVARPLANLLAGHRLHVWIDEGEIRPGDSLRAKIDEGLAASRLGVVIVSPHFPRKPWTQAELGGLFARELLGSKVLVPVWHQMEVKDVAAGSPLLSDRLALSTARGLDAVAAQIAKVIRHESPGYRPGMPIFAGKLTKKAFMSLPDGAYLMSNVVKPDLTPAHVVEMPVAAEREMLWVQLKSDGLPLTRFYAFADAVEYRAHMSARNIWSV
jgi:hypothetical protein